MLQKWRRQGTGAPRDVLRSVWTSSLRQLPRGHTLEHRAWCARHQILTSLLALHVPALLAYGLVRHAELVHTAVELLVLALLTGAAYRIEDRSLASACTAVGLVTCSALFVHMTDGLIEAHFHFFVIVALLTLYQDWLPFLLAVGFVLLHHAVLGTLAPREVYNHPAAWASPVRWAVLHGLLLLASAAAGVAAWRVNERHALQDGVTRLPNRRLFHDRASHALGRRRRDDRAVAALYIDLDRFKEVNDTVGHAGGDRLLAVAAERISATTRRGDTVARIGGDEFAVLVEDLDGDADASMLAGRLVTNLAEPFEISRREFTIGASVGVAISRPGITVDELLLEADTAMYRAKSAGGGRFSR